MASADPAEVFTVFEVSVIGTETPVAVITGYDLTKNMTAELAIIYVGRTFRIQGDQGTEWTE